MQESQGISIMAKRETSVGSMTPAQATAIAEAYLSELRDTRATHANMPETSYYPVLANLFNAVGKTLKPKVRCIMNLKDQGADYPDGGLFTADQFGRRSDAELKGGLLPSRGAVEAKSPNKDVKTIATSDQVRKYLDLYGIVLVTNLRDFLIVERGPDQQPKERESFSLGHNEKDFWQNKVAHPRTTANEKGQQFIEFVKRACLHNAPLQNPKEVAWFLASYAKDALARVEQQRQLPALQAFRSALEEALGMKFTEEKGEHFFRSTLVQTLFYGVFSAWVLWCRENPHPNAVFDWGLAAKTLHVPFVRSLYWQLAHPRRLMGLNLIEVLEWVDGVLNRVDRTEFFKRFREEHAVQYFYEPFLEAYDPELRKALGVWYTPPEIVKYQVARVDAVLREELNLPDGLADPNVIVLDPCCGTGTYLVEVLRQIATTLRGKGADALIASDLKEAAMNRVFGFEVLPAPFVVAHLQLGLMLQKEGAPLSHHKDERVGVYLTNALTGWEPPKGAKATLPLPYPELEEERDAAEQVKRKKKILVILGNPPYNAFAGVGPEEEQGLVEPYKKDLNKPMGEGGWGIRKFNLDDLYVRFFRLAERRIAEMTGQGVISFISNFSYLSDPSFVVMRQRFLAQFDKFWLDCMNGDSRETGKLTPDGMPDPSVFSTEYNREGIRVGTAVCVIVRKPTRQRKPVVRFRHFWGVNKRAELHDSLKTKRFNATYTLASPSRDNRLSFRPEEVAGDYVVWPKIVDLCAVPPLNGLMEKRGGALIDMDRARLEERMRDYLNADLSWEDYKARRNALTENAAAFNAKASRQKAIDAETFDVNRLCRYTLRPFDVRWCYYTSVSPVWNRARPRLWAQLWRGNRFLITRFRSSSDWEGHPISFTTALLDDHYIVPDAVAIPLRLCNGDRLSKRQRATLFDALDGGCVEDQPVSNVSKRARVYLATLGLTDPDADTKTAELLWMHALAIAYSPAYLTENTDGIRRDWPRVPLPSDRKALQASAALGEQLASLLDTEAGVPGVTTGTIAPALKTIGLTTRMEGNEIDLALTAGWGHGGKDGVVMPAKGKLSERSYEGDEVKAIEAEGSARGMTARDVIRLLGEKTRDVYLNDTAYWRNIPVNVWDYHIGGYQVIKKWLSYREQELLGRPLKSEEAREVMNMARRIAAIILLQPKLDANYQAIKKATYPWSAGREV
jgi:hypothetical protein